MYVCMYVCMYVRIEIYYSLQARSTRKYTAFAEKQRPTKKAQQQIIIIANPCIIVRERIFQHLFGRCSLSAGSLVKNYFFLLFFSFTLYRVCMYSRVGRSNLVLRHCVPLNFGSIACFVAELNAVPCYQSKEMKILLNNSSSHRVGIALTIITLQSLACAPAPCRLQNYYV